MVNVKPTAILGISAYYHDSAAALVVDGKIVAAAQEERFTRIKHDHAFPSNAIAYCLQEAGLKPGELDYVGFYDKPFLKFERILETYLAFAPVGFRSFLKAMPLWMRQKLHLPREIRRELAGEYRRRIVFTEHHESHAASAFFPSPFDEAAILTLDGVGEWATASFGIGRGNRVELSHELHFPHSLGLLYSAFTFFCGFKVNSGEYKLMGLAPYGEPKYADVILDKLVDLKDDGSFRLDLTYFNYCQGLTMTSKKFDELFGGPPRAPETPLTQREMDLAASIQKVTEEIVLRAVRHLHSVTGMKNLCLAGGVALNCVGNGRILREGPFERIWIQPAAGDAGGALGTALFIWYQLLGNERQVREPDGQDASLLGPNFSDEEIRAFLDQTGAVYQHFDDENELDKAIVDLIEHERVVGLLQGRMEFGPRALGCRSIIGDARSRDMQSVMNLKIKFRESFRPFAPIVLRERVSEFFEMDDEADSPYMLLVADVAEGKRLAVSDDGSKGLDKLKVIRSEVPAITHVDNSARVQTVDPVRHQRLHRLMRRFEERTGCPVMINTSFNVRGEPIVCTPEHAYHCFMGTDMDVLVLENFLLVKEEQPQTRVPDRDAYLAQFELD
jgi:carbamoyltransferase